MKDSHAGAFAILAGLCFFVLYMGFLSETDGFMIRFTASGFVMSRALSGLALALFPKARDTGLARTFSDAAANRRVAAVMGVYAVAVSGYWIWLSPVRGLILTGTCILFFAWYRHFSVSTFGGITGDTEGFFSQITELILAAGPVLLRIL